jgi:hypothetical protein
MECLPINSNELLRKLHNTPLTGFSIKYKNNQYLLHIIAPYADEASIDYCIDKYPKALELYDGYGMLPIHIAMLANPSNDGAARVMIYKNPAVAFACDSKGRTISDIRGKHSDSLWDYRPGCFSFLNALFRKYANRNMR